MKLTIKTLYVLLVLLNIFDMGITFVGLQLGAREISPVTLWHWEKLGVESSILFRIGILGFFGAITVVGGRVLTGRDVEIYQSVIWSILFSLTLFCLVVVTRNIEIAIRILTV